MADESLDVVSEDVDESSEGISSEDSALEAIRLAYEDGEELTDAQLDFVADTAISILRAILACFGEYKCSIDEYDGDEGELILDINDGDLAILIGRHGVTLDALQVVFSSMLNKKLGFHYPVIVDVESYKSRRREKVQSVARSSASRAKKNGRAVKLAPMNAYERRLVHLALRGDTSVTTHSEGVDPTRCVVITPVRG